MSEKLHIPLISIPQTTLANLLTTLEATRDYLWIRAAANEDDSKQARQIRKKLDRAKHCLEVTAKEV